MSREDLIANLEIYLDQAINSGTDELDISALDYFCELLKKEPDLNVHATRIIAAKIQSQVVKESLFALEILEECMDTLGSHFQIEVNKFKFLNELIRLVSKKFLGDRTAREIQDRILDILFTWTDKYPELGKIKEAYTMLRNQGVIHEPQKNVIKSSKKSTDGTLKLMENEKFKRLLQSKNQKDIEAANLMIQNMVRDNDRRCQMLNRRLIDLQSGNANAILLKQMLDEFDPNEASEDTLATLQEIYSHCVKLRPTVTRLMEEPYESESIAQETFDSINTAIELYTAIIIDKQPGKKKMENRSTNLFDVAEPKPTDKSETFSELNEIFSSSNASSQFNNLLLEPQVMPQTSNIDIMALINKHKPSGDDLVGNFNLKSPHTPTKMTEDKQKPLSELDSLVSGMKTLLGNKEDVQRKDSEDDVQNLIDDDVMIFKVEEQPSVEEKQRDIKTALKDIHINLSEIQPSEKEAPRTIIDEKRGLKVVVNFTQERPAKDVLVLVITVINQGQTAITNFHFDASVTKPCKLRILEASDTKLPGVKPFKPPTELINQVLLLLNPTEAPVNMIAILTYNLHGEDDPYKESIEVKDIPFKT